MFNYSIMLFILPAMWYIMMKQTETKSMPWALVKKLRKVYSFQLNTPFKLVQAYAMERKASRQIVRI